MSRLDTVCAIPQRKESEMAEDEDRQRRDEAPTRRAFLKVSLTSLGGAAFVGLSLLPLTTTPAAACCECDVCMACDPCEACDGCDPCEACQPCDVCESCDGTCETCDTCQTCDTCDPVG